jgi:hypothetical protein
VVQMSMSAQATRARMAPFVQTLPLRNFPQTLFAALVSRDLRMDTVATIPYHSTQASAVSVQEENVTLMSTSK